MTHNLFLELQLRFINGSAINRISEAGCCGYGTIMLQQADGMVIFYIHSK